MSKNLSFETILAQLTAGLEPLKYVQAMWEGGAASSGRRDAWSDIDLQIVVDDDCVEPAFQALESSLESLSPIDLKYELPQPTWHGHAQAFYRLKDASPFLLLDLCIMKASSVDKFLEPEIHGPAQVLFDKTGVTANIPPLDMDALSDRLKQRRQALRVTFDLFQVFITKELNRGNPIEAMAYYQAYTLRPLVEVLNMRYRPARSNFYTRYVYSELPDEVARRLEPLIFIRDQADLAEKHSQAGQWFHQEMDRFDA